MNTKYSRPDRLHSLPRPDAQEIRETVDHILANAPSRFRDWSALQYAVAILVGLVCLPVGMWIQSTWMPTGVDNSLTLDGIVLSQDEKEFIRGMRAFDQSLADLEKDNSERVIIRTRSLMEEGSQHGSHQLTTDL